MQCPKCQFENLDDSVFCRDCGAPLLVSCPSCGSAPPPGYKFCNKCGHDLRKTSEEPIKELSFDDKLSVIRCANTTGISCFIDPSGRLIGRVANDQQKDIFFRGFLTLEIPFVEDRNFYTRYGNIFVYLCGIISILFIVI